MYQDENENEPEDESFRLFWIKPVMNKPGPQYYDTLKERFKTNQSLGFRLRFRFRLST